MNKIVINFLTFSSCFSSVFCDFRSPCPTKFEYTVNNEGKNSALIKLKLSRKYIHGFNVTAIFVSETNEVEEPILTLKNEFDHQKLMQSIVNEEQVEIDVKFLSKLYKIYKISVNNFEECRDFSRKFKKSPNQINLKYLF